MKCSIRPAVPDDFARLMQIAAEGDFSECDADYLSFIANVGRLLCSTMDQNSNGNSDRRVVGFAGTVPAGDVAMVTDLFVASDARGSGVGGRLLAELLDGSPRRMTFSAQHQAALVAYQRMGMSARGRMLYLSGRALGGGSQLVPARWEHDRDDLVGYFVAQGSVITAHAIVAVADAGVEVLRLDASDAIAECQELLSAFVAGTTMKMYVSERHPLAEWLLAHDFVVTDFDVLCTSAGVDLPPTLASLHPGLA